MHIRLHNLSYELLCRQSVSFALNCTKVPGCVEKLLRKITQVRDIIDKQDFVPKVSQISPLVSGI